VDLAEVDRGQRQALEAVAAGADLDGIAVEPGRQPARRRAVDRAPGQPRDLRAGPSTAPTTISGDDRVRLEQAISGRVRSYGIDDLDLPKHLRTTIQERLESFWLDALDTSEEELADHLRAVATRSLGLPAEVVSALDAERKYRAAMKHWESYQTWKVQRNRDRADLERRHGYDTKHAMHLVRLMRMGLEVVRTGELRVRRADADELAAIRNGALTFDELIEQAEGLQRQMVVAAATSELPPDIDPARVDALAFELMT
jgi:hypothetical protein